MVEAICVSGHFSNATQVVAGIMDAVLSGEPFVSLVNAALVAFSNNSPKNDGPKVPRVEMLLRKPDGTSAGYYFDEARLHGCVVEADIINFDKAIKTHLEMGIPVSINLNAETFFSPLLFTKINELIHSYPNFKPSDICLEITEQGGVPANFDESALKALKRIGFSLALDDYDPRQAIEQDRLEKFSSHVNFVKFPYQVLEMVRDGTLHEAETLANTIKAIKDEHPHIRFVMEGVRSTDDGLIPILKQMGIDLIQLTSYVAEPKTPVTHPIPFPSRDHQ